MLGHVSCCRRWRTTQQKTYCPRQERQLHAHLPAGRSVFVSQWPRLRKGLTENCKRNRLLSCPGFCSYSQATRELLPASTILVSFSLLPSRHCRPGGRLLV